MLDDTPGLQALCLGYNRLGDAGFLRLADALPRLQGLTRLAVECNHTTHVGSMAVLEALAQPGGGGEAAQIRELGSSGNGLLRSVEEDSVAAGAHHAWLAGLLRRLSGLEALSVFGETDGVDGLEEVAAALEC